jgi:hypothetical protein
MTDLPDRLKATGIPACAEWDKNFGEGSFGRALTSERAETSVFRYADACIAALLDAVDEMVPKGWDGLLTILDDIYPASVFGGVDSDWHDEKRDIGPRLVTLARHLDAERHRAEKAEAEAERLRCCGNCEHRDEETLDYYGSYFVCLTEFKPKTNMRHMEVDCEDHCHFAPSRWKEAER